MKLGFSTNAYSRHSLVVALRGIASAGYEGVEILADKPHWYPDHFDVGEAESIRAELAELKLKVSNVNANCTFGYWKDAPPEPFFEPSLISPDPTLRAHRIQFIRNTLQFAKAIGAENISITSGKPLPTVPPEAAMKLLRENLLTVLETAEKLKIRVGIECEPMLFIEWATELRELIDRVGSTMLGANLDFGHSQVIGEDIPATIKLLGDRIWNCHIEDIPGRKHYHLIPGQGTMNWLAIKKALQAIQYKRFLTVELYTYPDRPNEAAIESIAYLKPIFGEE